MREHRKVSVVLWFFVCALTAVAFGMAGCRKERATSTGSHEEVMVQGTNAWFPLSQLRQLADERVQEHGAKLSQEQFEVTASVYADAGTNLVTFQYFRGFGVPVYYVNFDKSGSVSTFTNKIASEYIQPFVLPKRKIGIQRALAWRDNCSAIQL